MDVDVSAVPCREPGMEPFEIMTSESQERMLAVVEPSKEDAVLALCTKWQTASAVIGEVTDSGTFRILRNGETVGAAFYRMMTLEFACTSQIRALGTGREILHAPKHVQEAMPAHVEKLGHLFVDFAFWPAMLRKAARDCPGFDS